MDPRSGQTIGMIRTIRSELALPFVTLEIEPTEAEFSSLVTKVLKKVRASEDTDNLLPDREFAVDRGIVKIGRYRPFPLVQEVSITDSSNVKSLEIAKPGLLETLRWVEENIPIALQNDQVEIETRAVGLNFRVNSNLYCIFLETDKIRILFLPWVLFLLDLRVSH
jgi:hypothetical protein